MKATVFNTMKQRGTMSKVSKLLLLISLSFLFIFTSCDNLFENSVSEESSSKQKKEQTEETPEYVTISGKLDVENLEGAFPSQMLASKDAGSSKRSAIFSIPGGTDYEYYITATSSKGEKVITPQANALGVISYTFTLETGVQWTFKAGFRNKNNPEQILLQDKDTLAGSPFTKTFTVSNPGYTHTFTLLASQSEGGKGKVDLSMVIEDSDIVDLKLFKQDGNPWMEEELDISTASSPFSIKSKNDAFNIPSGSYSVTFVFYKKYSNLDDEIYQAYITYQTISVFDNMETKVWIGGKSSGSIITEDGTFKLTDDLISSFANTTLYVGKPAGTPSTVTASDDNSGGAYAPLETFGEALKRIENHNKAAPYQIFISGEQKKSGGYTISSNITTAKASSITVTGLGNDAVLNAQDDGSVLSLNSSVPLTLKNLTITGGSAENGGGINVTANNASLYLGDGMVIAGNQASGNGGGINLGGANSKLFMYGNSVIGEYQALDYYSLSSDESYFVNKAVNGGGIYIGGSGAAAYIGAKGFDSDGNIQEETSKVCYISKNYATNGGGIYNAAGTVKFYKMNVIRNRATASGGGLYIDAASLESDQRGGSFYINAAVNGGGVYICDGASYALNGTVGTSAYPNTATTYGGAVYNAGTIKLESAAVIDHGNGLHPKTNDVYLANVSGTQKTITLATTALTSSQSIAVTIPDWKHGRGKQILSTTDDITIDSTLKGKFKTTENGWDLKNDTDNKITKIDAPIYVAGEETRYTCKGSGYSTPSDDDSTSGTKYHPFKTILEACKIMDDKDFDYTVYIDGEIKGAQTIPDTLKSDGSGNYNAKSVDIQGCNSDLAKDILNGNSSGSALTINTAVPVFLSKMTVTGGNSTGNGGGINITASGTLVDIGTITIKGNKAAKGGGLYVASGAFVYVHGNAIIGNNGIAATSDGADILSTAEKTAAALSSGLNIAANGGGIYNDGEIHFGNQRYKSGIVYAVTGSKIYLYGNVASVDGGAVYSVNKSSFSASNDYYLRYNYAAQKGGGIFQGGSLPQTTTGSIRIYVENNKAESGGGIYVAAEKQFSLCSGNSIMSNTATSGGGVYNAGTIDISRAGGKIALNTATNGGGIYNAASATVDMSKGNIGGTVTINNENKPGYNTATNGGAVYVCVSSKFQITGDAVIPVDSSLDDKTGKNDVYLQKNDDGEASIYFPGFGNTLSGTAPVATITPAEWKRGTKFLTTSTGVTGYFTTAFINKFAMSKDNSDWNQKLDPSNGDYPRFLYITMPVYVASSASDDATRKKCQPAPATGANGTPSAPYSTIAAALAEFNDTGLEGEIMIDGNVTGAQTIAGEVKASKLTISGYKASGATSSLAKLNGGFTAAAYGQNRTTLSITSTIPVTITSLTITGGFAYDNGGGIKVSGAGTSLTLGDGTDANGVTITGNKSRLRGAGVYIAGTGTEAAKRASLTIKNGVAINSNTITEYDGEGTDGGMGVYASYTNVAMSGGVISAHDASSNDKPDRIQGALYLNSSPFTMTGGKITENTTGARGANVFAYSSQVTIDGGEISKGTITNTANDGVACGAGIYMYDASGEFKSGTISQNSVTAANGYAQGGGICVEYGTYTVSCDGMTANTASGKYIQGGAVYLRTHYQGSSLSTLTLKGNAKIPYGNAVGSNDVFTGQVVYSGNKYSSKINISGTLNTSSGVATVTPEIYTREMQVLSGTANQFEKFSLPNGTDWSSLKIDSSTGKIVLANIVKDIYIKSNGTDPSGNTSEDITWRGCNANTEYKSFATLKKAAQFITWQNSSTTDYTIYIDGTIEGCQRLTNEDNATNNPINLIKSNTTTTAKSITICGTGSSPKIDAKVGNTAQAKASALYIKTSKVPVTIKNLSITGGNTSNYGGGIFADLGGASADTTKPMLTLGDGSTNVNVYSNKAINGGGVYTESYTELTIKDKVSIYSNSALKSGDSYGLGGGVYGDSNTIYMQGGDVYGNSAEGSGGGICAFNGILFVSGNACIGERSVDHNTPATGYALYSNIANNSGGGIYGANIYLGYTGLNANDVPVVESDTTKTCMVNLNFAKCEGDTAYGGGGVYSMGKECYVSSRAVIRNNGAAKGGGGIFKNGKNLILEGGSILYNKAEEGDGGAIGANGSKLAIKMKGDVYIPAGGMNVTDYWNTEHNNDVYLPNNVKITIIEDLSNDTVASITPYSNSNMVGKQIIASGEGFTGSLPACVKKFNLTDASINHEKIIDGAGYFKNGLTTTLEDCGSVIGVSSYTGYTIVFEDTITANDIATISSKLKMCTTKHALDFSRATISGTIELSGENSFSGCAKLTEVIFDGSKMKPKASAFANCTSLETLRVVTKCDMMVDWARSDSFTGCTALTTLDCSGCSQVRLNGGLYVNPSGLTTIILGESLTTLGMGNMDYYTADGFGLTYAGMAADFDKDNGGKITTSRLYGANDASVSCKCANNGSSKTISWSESTGKWSGF